MISNINLTAIALMALPIILSVTLHEIAHGYVAYLRGDNTAKNMGRLSLNPFRHVDLLGTIILPLILFVTHAPFMFGWAKPVPVNFAALKKPKQDMIWVSIAGPLTNILLFIISLSLLVFLSGAETEVNDTFAMLLVNMMIFNLMLALFNLIPLPPLDGSKVVMGLLPMPLARKYASIERYGMLPILFLLMILPWIGSKIGVNLDFVSIYLSHAVKFIMQQISTLL